MLSAEGGGGKAAELEYKYIKLVNGRGRFTRACAHLLGAVLRAGARRIAMHIVVWKLPYAHQVRPSLLALTLQ